MQISRALVLPGFCLIFCLPPSLEEAVFMLPWQQDFLNVGNLIVCLLNYQTLAWCPFWFPYGVSAVMGRMCFLHV